MDDRTEPPESNQASLLSPERLNAYRLRQGTACLAVTLVTGLGCWFTWIGLRHSDDRIFKLLALMGFAAGAFLLFFALVSALGVICHSIYCMLRFRFGWPVLAFAILTLPLFALPYFFN